MISARAAALEFLYTTQNPDGGWGYAPGQTSAMEPSAAILLALASVPGDEAARRAFDWLLAGQHADGGWGYSQADAESTWHTAWALLALAGSPVDSMVLERGAHWLLKVDVLRVDDDEMQREALANNGVDLSIPGWPWLPGEATWVEPTALALRALKRCPLLPGTPERLAQGVKCLISRRCQGGGWNVGSPFMLNAFFPARAIPTAWAILALAELSPEQLFPADVAVLRDEMQRDNGTPALAWGLAALHSLGQEDSEAGTRLLALQAANGSWETNPYVTALALMALPAEGRAL